MNKSGELLELFARCASGFEGALALELRGLHARQVRPLKGGVSFAGDVTCAYRACLWSRVATRMQLVLDRVDARDADALYDGAAAFAWESHVAPGATIAVQAHGDNPNLRNTQFTALKVKDAVCDRLRRVNGERPDVDAKDPDFEIDVSLHEKKATLYLNLSGKSLHRRGYRQDGVQVEAPLKETLAAGILQLAGWPELAKEGAPFADPLCGSGTFAIEAAMAAADIAPGILRDRWGFAGWARHDEDAWETLLDEADGRMQAGLASCACAIVAGDIDERAIEIARANAKRAGVGPLIDFRIADAASFVAPVLRGLQRHGEEGLPPAAGLMAVNPPYGLRLLSRGELPRAYAALATAVDALPQGWRLAVITPDAMLDAMLGQEPGQVIPCYNGPIEAAVRLYDVAPSNRIELQVTSLSGVERAVVVAEQNSGQFAARLRKVAKERARWARKAHVTCYRVYDADLPDYSLSVDLYRGCEIDQRSWYRRSARQVEDVWYARIAEYAAPPSIDSERAARRFADALAIVPAVLDIDPKNVFAKVRRHAKGGGQYRDARSASKAVRVREGGYRFEADLDGYLDTGIFLDHRDTRAMVGQMAEGKRFLNLFAYTGTATVYAAGGGAVRTVTVDLSQTYLNWAQRNMVANGFRGRNHAFVRADVMQWLRDEHRKRHTYDLIFCDPPTFSNSKSMGKSTFSVQRDHVGLLRLAAGLLASGGTVVFSCNLRDFKLDVGALAERGLEVQDITAQTIPHDFARSPKIHKCYLIGKLQTARREQR